MLMGGLAVTAAAELPEEPEAGITDQNLEDSVREYPAVGSVRQFGVEESVERLGEDIETEDGETTLSLSTDILFGVNSWEISSSASARIAELVEDVPDGATVTVAGHTDSVPTGEDFDNQELSENRAQAVADAIADERPDLDLAMMGYGDSEPAVDEDPEDPETLAANRRVEISYSS